LRDRRFIANADLPPSDRPGLANRSEAELRHGLKRAVAKYTKISAGYDKAVETITVLQETLRSQANALMLSRMENENLSA
jgi:hypothetical protein